ncbi:MAG TPA: hypothetical protein VF972_01540, partial [Actinomycetota bacterium]
MARALVWAIAAIAAAALGMTLLAKGSTSGPLALVGVALALLGALVVRRAGNPIGWFFLVAGASIGLAAFTDAFINYSFLGRSTPLWGTSAAGWVNSVAFTTLSAPLPLIFLLFPSGRVPSGRWRPVVWLWTTSLVLLVAGVAFRPGNVFESTPQQGGIHIANPLGVHGAEPVLGPLIQAAVVGLVAVAALSTVSLFMRFRLAKGEERQQLKWLAYVAGLLVLLFAVLALGDAFTHDNPTGGLGVAE